MFEIVQVALCLDEVFFKHEAPPGHPERPERLRAIAYRIDAAGLRARSLPLRPRPAARDELSRVHEADYLARLESRIAGQAGYLDADTYYSPQSWDVAMLAAGAAVDATNAVLSREVAHAAVFVRPPGHHAETSRAMGFCLINNVAVAAAAARARGARRVAIVDWDVHHGNGTQEIFWRDSDVLYLSVHQYPFYPGTGASQEIGEGPGRGTTINVPLPAGMGEPEYAYVFDHVFIPALRSFEPEVVIVSAGFDAHRADPLAQMNLEATSYVGLSRRLRSLGTPMVAVLEGGYDLEGVASSAAGTLDALLEPAAMHVDSVGDCHPAAQSACARTVSALSGTPHGGALRFPESIRP